MEEQYKTIHRFYTAWNYPQEIDDLNRASEQGWQLVKGGCFSSKFKRNAEVCYRYQLDYPGPIEDMERYIDTFREQGWEYVNSTFNGWHYFRKLYDPAVPAERYEIFTDRSSLLEMTGRWVRIAAILTAAIAVYTALQIISWILMPKLPTLVRILSFTILLAMFLNGIRIMRNPEKNKRLRWDSILFAAALIVFLAGTACEGLLTENRPHFNSVFAGDEISPIPSATEGAFEWNTLEIKYSDNYYVDLSLTAASPVCFTIANEAGEAVYTAQGTSAEEKGQKIRLERGKYTLLLSDFAGGPLNLCFEIG